MAAAYRRLRRPRQGRPVADEDRGRPPAQDQRHPFSARLRAHGQTGKIEHLDGLGAGLVFVDPLVQHDGFAYLVADGMDGAEGGHRLLGHERDLVPADAPHHGPGGVELGQPDFVNLAVSAATHFAVKGDLAADDASWLRHDAEDRAGGDALAAAAFADHAQRLAVPDLELDTVDRPDGALVQEEVGAQVSDIDKALVLFHVKDS